MLDASEEEHEIDGSGHSCGGDMSQEGVSILQHVIFFSTYYSIHSNPCLTMVTLYECKRHRRSLHRLFGLDLHVVQM